MTVVYAAAPLLEVRDLFVSFDLRRGRGRPSLRVAAVSGLSISIMRGETVALVGESGSGKTTVARTILGLEKADAGEVLLDGKPVDASQRKRSTDFRRRTQLVSQDPYASLDPRMRVGDQVIEAQVIAGTLSRSARRARASQLLESVGLGREALDRYPHQFSGGQRQRVAIARALALGPEVLICDEPVSALDVSIQAQIINLLQDLQADLDVSYLLISHDLALVRTIAQRVSVMYLGRIVEAGLVGDIFATPLHPYTQALISAVPSPSPSVERKRKRIILTGEIPSPTAVPSGCAFRTRCRFAIDRCGTELPQLRPVGDGSTLVACHRAEEIPAFPPPDV